MAAKRPRLKTGFTLGGEQAEADPLLEDAFFNSSDYEIIASREDYRCFIVGRTGSGKSAALQRLEDQHDAHVIRINPEDLSLPYITDMGVIRYLDSLDVNLDLFWIALWKHVLLVEIIRHRYNVNTPETKQRFLGILRDKLSRQPGKTVALEYLDEFEGRFWCETDERVREITDKFTSKFNAEVGLGGGISNAAAKAGGSTSSEKSSESHTERLARYQRVVNETQLAKLNTMIGVLNDEILDSQHFTYLIIDDLDRDWVDERLANDLIRCLFRTVLDLQRVQNLKVLVALRTNIFQELDFGKRSGGQEEKFRALVMRMSWTRHDLEQLLDERARVAGGKAGLHTRHVAEFLPHANKTRDPLSYIFDRTLLRPRDAIAFVNECLALGAGRTRLSWLQIQTAERAYSNNRLLGLRDEWKGTYPAIDRVFEVFRNCPNGMVKLEFQGRLDDIMLLLTDSEFAGVRWLMDKSQQMWAPGPDRTWFELYQPLANLLYGIGLIGCSARTSAAPVFHHDDPLFMESESNLEDCDHFFIHRTYHLALDVRHLSRS